MIHRICPLKRNLGFGLGPRLDPLPCREKLFAASSSPPSLTSISYRHSTIQTEDGRGCPALSSCIENNVSITSASNAGSMSAASGGGGLGCNFLIIILYGRPHVSDSTNWTRYFQDRAFAILFSHCNVRGVSQYAI
jgi:hypothetical protein